jgi:hypothetical protein
MDSMITAAGRALAEGDPLGALKRVALREDAPALALRGIAMAQLGDFDRARALVRRAARAFGSKESVARARCVVAEAEIALAARDLSGTVKALDGARATLEAHGDRINAGHARCIEVRRLLLIGRLEEAEHRLDDFNAAGLPPALRAVRELMVMGIAMRRLQAGVAGKALQRAGKAAQEAGIPALIAEVENASRVLNAPAARWIRRDQQQLLQLEEVEALLVSTTLVVDACRNVVHGGKATISLASRPVLFALLRALAQAWPDDAPRDALILHAFRLKRADESLRVRLRVEMGRLRNALKSVAEVSATRAGFVLKPLHTSEVVVLAPPVHEKHAEVLALLADGEAWSSSALALALGASQRSVQRALDALDAAGKLQSVGRGRARRWMAPPMPGFATSLLLPAPLPGD